MMEWSSVHLATFLSFRGLLNWSIRLEFSASQTSLIILFLVSAWLNFRKSLEKGLEIQSTTQPRIWSLNHLPLLAPNFIESNFTTKQFIATNFLASSVIFILSYLWKLKPSRSRRDKLPVDLMKAFLHICTLLKEKSPWILSIFLTINQGTLNKKRK